MRFKEIKIGKSSTLVEERSIKRGVIQDYLGKEVILRDGHKIWCHGILLKDGYDDEVYQIKIKDERGQRQLHYDDLNQLLVKIR